MSINITRSMYTCINNINWEVKPTIVGPLSSKPMSITNVSNCGGEW